MTDRAFGRLTGSGLLLRLRGDRAYFGDYAERLFRDAADRIEALEAERERDQTYCGALEYALNSIIDGDFDDEATSAARRALERSNG